MLRKLVRIAVKAIVVLLLVHVPAAAQIVNIEDKRVRLRDSSAWAGNVDVGFSILQNTKQIITGRLGFLVEYSQKKHFVMGLGGFNALQADRQKLTNDGFLHLRHNYELRPRWVTEAYTQIQYNELMRIRSRSLVGAGLRYKIRYQKQRLYLGASYMFERNLLQDLTELRYHRFSSYLSINLTLPNGSRFVSTTYYQPVLTDLANARVASETSLQFKITKNTSFRTVFALVFDGDPLLPEAVPNTTYSLTNGLRFDF